VATPEPLVNTPLELSALGRIWVGLGAAALAVVAAGGWLFELTGSEVVAIALVFGFTSSAALGGLLLARRTGPAQLYASILRHSPEPPPGYPREEPGRTRRRVVGPALTVMLLLLLVSPVGVASVLMLGGQPRDDVVDHLAAASVALGAAWTLLVGAAALRMAWYFSRYERRYDAVVFCLPLRAGLMGRVYYVEQRPPARG